jgi:competence protein ComEA
VIVRITLGVIVFALVALAFRRPAPAPALQAAPIGSAATPFFPAEKRRDPRRSFAPLGATVYVVGAVARPGLYRLSGNPRAVDAVTAAGGLTRQADRVAVNLAAFVHDGDELIVPAIGQARALYTSRHRTRSRHARSRASGTVDINAASADELATVPGIGRAVAERIVEMRERVGSFDSLDELLDVAGMTDTRLERARPYLTTPGRR